MRAHMRVTPSFAQSRSTAKAHRPTSSASRSVSGSSLKRRLLTAAIAAAAFALPLIWSLSTQILFRVEEPLAVAANQPLFALQIPELTYLRTADGQSTYRLRLSAPQLRTLLERSEIGLRVADYEETRTILSAAIISPAANCSYAAR